MTKINKIKYCILGSLLIVGYTLTAIFTPKIYKIENEEKEEQIALNGYYDQNKQINLERSKKLDIYRELAYPLMLTASIITIGTIIWDCLDKQNENKNKTNTTTTKQNK